MALTRTEAAARNLREVERRYADAHAAAHRAFTAAYDELLGQYGITVSSHADYHELPAELHEELKPHKEALAAALAQASDARHSSVAPERPRVNLVRAIRTVG